MRAPLMLLLGIVGVSQCLADPSAGPQRYLLFNFHIAAVVESRMLSADTPQFAYTARPRNFGLGHDLATVRAKLLERTAKGFRLSFSLVHSSHGRVVGRTTETFLFPSKTLNEIKTLYSSPTFTAKCFYSKEPVAPVVVQ